VAESVTIFKVDKPLTLGSGRMLGNFTPSRPSGAASTDWVRKQERFPVRAMIVAATTSP
jgi:hypothetical protein